VGGDLVDSRVDDTAKHLPIIKDRWNERAGQLSGGQRQLVSIARALVTGAPLLLLDEPSVGLAPKLVEEMMDLFAALRDEGKTVILVEQNVKQALRIADDAVVIKSGRVILAGESLVVTEHPDMWSLF
jgi:branched-chain amino acid transport system ATP-binding protein